jgi:erythromycin esterase
MMKHHRTTRLIHCFLLFVLIRCAYSSANTESVTNWVTENAIPFTTARVTSDSSDLECLRSLIGDARVVALGEQTHGTSEFQTMKHRIVQFLVEKMGFTTLALEATWSGTLIANRYVTEGKIGHRTSSTKLGYWFYSSSEFQSLLQWMRAYNGRLPSVSVQLVGIDYGFPELAFEWIESTLSAAKVFLPADIRQAVQDVRGSAIVLWEEDVDARQAWFAQAQSILQEILNWLPEYESALTVLEIDIIQRIPRLLEQQEERRLIGDTELQPNASGWYTRSFNFRDRCMAENLTWWLDTLGEDTKIIVWAHNGHVAASWPEAGLVPLGQNLSNRYRDDFVSIGFSTCAGSFFTFNSEIRALDSLSLPEPESNSYESMFCDTGIDNFYLDLRDLQPGSDVDTWMSQSRGFKVLGAGPDIVDGLVVSAYDTDATLPNMFDIVIHMKNTKSIHYVR